MSTLVALPLASSVHTHTVTVMRSAECRYIYSVGTTRNLVDGSIKINPKIDMVFVGRR